MRRCLEVTVLRRTVALAICIEGDAQSGEVAEDGKEIEQLDDAPLGEEADHFTNFTSTFGKSAFTLACVSSG